MTDHSKDKAVRIIERARAVVNDTYQDALQLQFELATLSECLKEAPALRPTLITKIVEAITKIGVRQTKITVAVNDSRELLTRVIKVFDPAFEAMSPNKERRNDRRKTVD